MRTLDDVAANLPAVASLSSRIVGIKADSRSRALRHHRMCVVHPVAREA
jgi:hypothetical protein